jgi:hypothetical protein
VASIKTLDAMLHVVGNRTGRGDVFPHYGKTNPKTWQKHGEFDDRQ